MYNRLPFNNGGFNTGVAENATEIFFEGASEIILTLDGDFEIARMVELEGVTEISLQSENHEIIRRRELGVVVDLATNSKFNRMGFNRGRFNTWGFRRSSAVIGTSASANMCVITSFDAATEIAVFTELEFNKIKTFSGVSEILLDAQGEINIAKPMSGTAEINLATAGRFQLMLSLGGASDITLETASAGFVLFVIEHIHLPNLIVPPGGELIIDTDNMTVLLNGQNVMRFLSRDSEFFLLNPSINEVTFTSANQNNRASTRILWKDAWL
ncbi:MAG: hypothetical protein FWB80_00190 [Defluviitaleaceae bacterium]|nr:hypothetical protein [Defluviitaleaceae bacterium]